MVKAGEKCTFFTSLKLTSLKKSENSFRIKEEASGDKTKKPIFLSTLVLSVKEFSKLKLFGLVFILIGALIFIGINSLEAKRPGDKPPKPDKPGKPGKEPTPEYTWQVVIPGVGSAYNLFGYYPQQNNIYEDLGAGDGIYVEVKKKGGRKGAESQFRLAVFNNIGGSGCTTPWPDGQGDRKIGFQGIVITDHWDADTIDDEYPCSFPTYPYPDCKDPAWGKLGRPGCMATFLQNPLLHPYCDPSCGHPECSYEYVEIAITVNCNFEDVLPGVPATPSGDVQVRVVNTFDLQSGCEYPHNISSHLLEQDFYEGAITIVKVDTDTWEITVDALITFTEIYKGTWRNRWEYKIPYWAQIPFTFKTTWIRNEVTAN